MSDALGLAIGGIGSFLGGRSQQNAARYQADVQSNIFANQAGIFQNNLDRGFGYTIGARDSANQRLADAQRSATQILRGAGQSANDRLNPYYNTGRSALGQLMGSVSPQSVQPFRFEEDPGYEFRRSEGVRGLQDRAAAGGSRLSGGAMRDVMDYTSGLASQEYGNAFNRYLAGNQDQRAQEAQRYNQLFGIAGMGQNAANTMGANDLSVGRGIAANDMAVAGAMGANDFRIPEIFSGMSTGASIGTSNALSDLGSGLAQSSQNSANATNAMLNSLAYTFGQGSEMFGGNTNIGGVDVDLSGALPRPGNRNVLSFL